MYYMKQVKNISHTKIGIIICKNKWNLSTVDGGTVFQVGGTTPEEGGGSNLETFLSYSGCVIILLLFQAQNGIVEKVKMSILHRPEDDVLVYEFDKNCSHPWSRPWMERTVTISVKEVLLDRQWDDGTLTINLKERIWKV